MHTTSTLRQRLFSDTGILLMVAAAYFLVHMASTVIGQLLGGYGYFIDEFYYIACAKRLAFGYVDHPPLAPFLLRLVLETFGQSLVAIRLLPALTGAGTLVLTGAIARRLGGGLWAQVLAALSLAVAPVFLVMSGFFSMNAFEALFWTACIYTLFIIIQDDRPRLWLAVGGLIGLGLLNKHTLIMYVGTLFIGLLFTPARKYVVNRWFWFGAMLAALLILPNLVWQVQHGYPSLEFYRNATASKNIDTAPIQVVATQMFSMNPLTTPIWILGLGWLLTARRAKPYRLFGIGYLLLLLFMIISRSSRPDRILAAYPVLLAAGALVVEQGIRHYPRLRFAKTLIPALLVLAGLLLLPFALPLAPPEQLARIGSPVDIEEGVGSQLPQWLADRFGWEEFVDIVADAYQGLSPQEQAKCAIFAMNYGQAGALELFDAQYGLPRALAGHNTYWLWGYDGTDGNIALITGGNPDELRQVYESVTIAGTAECEYCRPANRRQVVYLAKGLRMPMAQLWAQVKSYD